jgi:import inner membrane translocase subunit TIM13
MPAIPVLTRPPQLQKINEHCYERCVPKPSSAISRGEESCYSACMEKYMAAWNTVSKGYVERMQKDGGIRTLI